MKISDKIDEWENEFADAILDNVNKDHEKAGLPKVDKDKNRGAVANTIEVKILTVAEDK